MRIGFVMLEAVKPLSQRLWVMRYAVMGYGLWDMGYDIGYFINH